MMHSGIAEGLGLRHEDVFVDEEDRVRLPVREVWPGHKLPSSRSGDARFALQAALMWVCGWCGESGSQLMMSLAKIRMEVLITIINIAWPFAWAPLSLLVVPALLGLIHC